MDEISRGIASAALTLQSVLLQALIDKGVLTRAEGIDVAQRALELASESQNDDDESTAEVAAACLAEVLESLTRTPGRN